MQGVAVQHPSEETGIWSERDHGVALDVKTPLETVGIY
jgi:hypothetical protein